MKLGVSQSRVQSDDAVNILHPSWAGRQRLEARITKFVFLLHDLGLWGGGTGHVVWASLLAWEWVGFRRWGDSGGWRL